MNKKLLFIGVGSIAMLFLVLVVALIIIARREVTTEFNSMSKNNSQEISLVSPQDTPNAESDLLQDSIEDIEANLESINVNEDFEEVEDF